MESLSSRIVRHHRVVFYDCARLLSFLPELCPVRVARVLPILLLLTLTAIDRPAVAAVDKPFQYTGSFASRLYADLQIGVHGVRHSELDFYPGVANASVGFWIVDNIGVDIFADTSTIGDDIGVFELEVAHATGVALRFQSPHLASRLHAYMVLGYVDLQVEQKEERLDASGQRVGRTVRQSFSGVRISLGFARRLSVLKDVLVTGEYRNYYTEDEIQIDGLSLGLRVNLR